MTDCRVANGFCQIRERWDAALHLGRRSDFEMFCPRADNDRIARGTNEVELRQA